MEPLLWFLLGYLVGSFPTGYLLARKKGVDIRRYGSGNIGFANVYRVLGAKYAVLTAIGDILKGFLPVILAPNELLAVFAASGALLGAIFSLYLKFRGGKGFAALVGIWLALVAVSHHPGIFVAGIVLWITTLWLSRFTSLANLVTVSTLPSIVAFTGDPLLLFFSIFSLILIFYSHRENVGRLLRGEERSFLQRIDARSDR